MVAFLRPFIENNDIYVILIPLHIICTYKCICLYVIVIFNMVMVRRCWWLRDREIWNKTHNWWLEGAMTFLWPPPVPRAAHNDDNRYLMYIYVNVYAKAISEYFSSISNFASNLMLALVARTQSLSPSLCVSLSHVFEPSLCISKFIQ